MTKTNPGYKMFIGLIKEDQYNQLRKLSNVKGVSLAKTLRQILKDYFTGNRPTRSTVKLKILD